MNAAQAEQGAMPTGAGRAFRTWDVLIGPSWRGARVAAFLGAVAVLSMADLYMTLQHVMNFGLLEQNPVARLIISHGSPAGLAVWKVVTVGFAIGVMYRWRKRATAEAGALFCVGVLAWLMVRWVSYNEQASVLTRDTVEDPAWVTMAPGE